MTLKNKYVVSATLSDKWPEGMKLKTADQVVGYYRDAYNMANEPPLDLTDEQILAICEAIPSTDELVEDEIARIEAMEKGVAVAPTVSATGSAIRLAGINFGRSLPADIDTAFELSIKTQEDTDELPMMLAHIIDKVMPRGHNGKITAPIPGTPESETIKNADGSETVIKYDNPDRFATKTNGVREVSSFYLEAAMQRPAGKRILQVLDQIAAASGDNVTGAEQSVAHPNGVVTTIAGFKAMTAKSRKAAKITWKAKLDTALANRMRRAARIVFQCEAINNMNRILVSLASEPKSGAPALMIAGLKVLQEGFVPQYGAKKPIILGDKKIDNSAHDPMSITSFLNLKPDAVGPDASKDELVATGEKAPADKTPTGAADVKAIDGGDLTRWTDYLAETTAWIVEPGNMSVLRVAAANGKLPPQVVLSMHDLEELLSSMNAYTQKQFDLLETQRQQEREAEAADKQAKLAKTG